MKPLRLIFFVICSSCFLFLLLCISPDIRTLGHKSLIKSLHPKYSFPSKYNPVKKNVEQREKNMRKMKKKIKILVVSRITSGSSFLGDLIQSWERKSFYSYEPLMYIEKEILHTKFYTGIMAESQELEAFETIQDIYRCDFTRREKNIAWFHKNHHFLQKSTNLWSGCFHSVLPPKSEIVEKMTKCCEESNLNVIKVNRLQMSQVGKLMDHLDKDISKSLKIVLLIRDPRNVYSSRRNRSASCTDSCRDIGFICEDAKSNLIQYQELKKRYKNQVFIVRYEDLSTDPFSTTEDLFRKLRLDMNDNIDTFLEKHTNLKKYANRYKYTTYRDSKKIAFIWTQRLSRKEIDLVESNCSDLLLLAGYKKYDDAMAEVSNSDSPNSSVNFVSSMRIDEILDHHLSR